MQAWKSLTSYDTLLPLRPWVFRIGQNLLRNHLRRARLERKTSVPLTTEPRSRDKTPFGSAVTRERDRLLESAILDLPERQRVAVVLRYQEKLSCTEIAAVLETTANAVSIQLNRARRALRSNLGQTLMGEGR